MKQYLTTIFALTFIVLSSQRANCQTPELRTDGIYWCVSSEQPPLSLVIVFDGTRAQQSYKYGSMFAKLPTNKSDFSTDEGADYQIEDGTVTFSSDEGQYQCQIMNGELRTIVNKGSKKKNDQLTLKFKEFGEE